MCCSRCQNTWYCSPEHSFAVSFRVNERAIRNANDGISQHWRYHKSECILVNAASLPVVGDASTDLFRPAEASIIVSPSDNALPRHRNPQHPTFSSDPSMSRQPPVPHISRDRGNDTRRPSSAGPSYYDTWGMVPPPVSINDLQPDYEPLPKVTQTLFNPTWSGLGMPQDFPIFVSWIFRSYCELATYPLFGYRATRTPTPTLQPASDLMAMLR